MDALAGYWSIIWQFLSVGGWILVVPPLLVLVGTAYVLIGNAVDRHNALRDGDVEEWERHTTP